MGIVNGFEEVEIVAVCDPVEALRTAVADEFKAVGRYSSIEEMLDSEELDAAFVATPAHINGQAALPCLAAGVNTFVEKPPGLSLEETTALRDAAVRAGVQGMVGWNRRFHPQIVQTRQMVLERGPIVQLVGEFHKSMTRLEKRTDRFPEHLLDNYMWESPIHSIDLVRFLAGAEVVEVHSMVRRALHKYKDVYGALVLFENGCVGHFMFNLTTSMRLERYEIHGRDISAYLEGVNESIVYCDGERHEVPNKEGLGGTEEEDRYFIDCIREGRPISLPGANLDEAVKTMGLGEKIMAGFLAKDGNAPQD